jgi:NADP-dependent 3-hydroxy acid dehydrogenase YdfG
VAITGAARGIGRATAEALTREGARVAIGDLDGPLAEKAAAALPGEAIGLELDVTDRDSFADFIAQVEERLGPVDVLINNAGIMPLAKFWEESDDIARKIIDINVHGVLYGMKLVIPGMLKRGTGHIVNIASQAGKAGIPGGATYSASKHAVVGVSEAVRGELRDTPIEISCVMPVAVNTELAAGLVQSRGVTPVEPDEVAAEIVAALKRPRFDVNVPRSAGVVNKLAALLPRAGREALARAVRADKVLAEADAAQRAEYEQRAAREVHGTQAENEPAGKGRG